jgi:hypothetical protein
MKGIIFAGCSFTWGQGLYFYSDFPNVVPQTDDDFHPDKLTDAHIKFKDSIRFPRLVANHFNTIEIVRKPNGGNDKMSMDFVNGILNDGGDDGKYYIGEIDYIILQTSQIVRNGFEFIYNNTKYNITDSHSDKVFINWLIQENLTYDEWFTSFCQQVFDDIKKFFIFYEEKGIKTRVLSWQNDLVPYILNDKFMNDRHIKLDYMTDRYNSIDDLVKSNQNMLIATDYSTFEKPINDRHPSKLCHRIIANNIITNIKKDIK